MHGTVHDLLFTSVLFTIYCSQYCFAVLFKKIYIFFIFLVYLTLQMYDNMQELYFIKCLLVIHARNDASKTIF